MVGAPAAADAVARARRLPRLRVGLHLVLVEGRPVLPRAAVPALSTAGGDFPDGMLATSLRVFFDAAARRQLAAEIRAQYEAFRATGLALDHVNAHKHMHLHPTVARLLVEIGGEFGVKAVRVPAEPARVLRQSGAAGPSRVVSALHRPMAALLSRRLASAGLRANDHLLSLAWSEIGRAAR